MDQIWKGEGIPLWVRPYEILATGPNCGLIEVVSDALSIHGVKEKIGPGSVMKDYFKLQFGKEKSDKYKKAKDNFCNSLAAYSLVCYIL